MYVIISSLSMYYLKFVGLFNFLSMRTKLDGLDRFEGEAGDCGICMGDVREGKLLNCKHVFHNECLM